jgi:hypothetical protein
MSNLQVKGIDDGLYAQIKALAVSENRSVSQQILYLVRCYLANKKQFEQAKMPVEILLDLSGSWQDSRSAGEIVVGIKDARNNSSRFTENSDVFT